MISYWFVCFASHLFNALCDYVVTAPDFVEHEHDRVNCRSVCCPWARIIVCSARSSSAYDYPHSMNIWVIDFVIGFDVSSLGGIEDKRETILCPPLVRIPG